MNWLPEWRSSHSGFPCAKPKQTDRLTMTPDARLIALINGFQVSQAINVVATLGIADLLRDGAQDCYEHGGFDFGRNRCGGCPLLAQSGPWAKHRVASVSATTRWPRRPTRTPRRRAPESNAGWSGRAPWPS